MVEKKRHLKNAPGPFYVERDECISCGAPQAEAPGLVTLQDRDGCYFHRQPENPAEVNAAIRAMLCSCIDAYRYGGSDSEIRKRLAQAGSSHLCDHPLATPVLLRDRVRFSLAHAATATEIAHALLGALGPHGQTEHESSTVVGDSDAAELVHAAKHASPHRYRLERLPRSSIPKTPVAYRDPSTIHVWLLIDMDARHPPIWLHDVLVAYGAVDMRWFSPDAWRAGELGDELPF